MGIAAEDVMGVEAAGIEREIPQATRVNSSL
jgi:hypothetical protein